MKRRPLIAGNWKMFKTGAEARELVTALRREIGQLEDRDIVVAPPFTALDAVAQVLSGSNIAVAGQNLFWEKSGAYTGEISGEMLVGSGCRYVIVGHSERRQHFHETNDTVNRRLKAALSAGLIPIFCIGETLSEREGKRTWEVLTRQVVQGLLGIDAAAVPGIVLAYEPVWAIGTGLTATNAQAQEAHEFLRSLLIESYPRYVSHATRILYGGSVKPDNVDGLMAQPDVDGVLVGGASLKADGFARIVKFQAA